MSGASFVSVDEPTKGTASIVTENGQSFLVLDEAFSTKEGPDVLVLLHKEAVPKSYTESNYLNLGKLQKISGTQRYAIPAGTNVKDFRTVSLWCRKFKVTFGYAPLP
nr:DM13 domain-containing protein [Oscillatoria sp. FACHB-1406]